MPSLQIVRLLTSTSSGSVNGGSGGRTARWAEAGARPTVSRTTASTNSPGKPIPAPGEKIEGRAFIVDNGTPSYHLAASGTQSYQRRRLMDDRSGPTANAILDRRHLLLSGAALAGALAAGEGALDGALAQNAAIATPHVTVERLAGSVLLIGINRPQVENRIEVPTFLGLGRAYWQLDHDDELRVAVLFAHGDDFSPGLDAPSWAEAIRSGLFRNPVPEFVNPVGTSKPYRLKPLVVAAHGRTQLLGHEL